MANELDDIKKEVASIAELVKTHANDKATIDQVALAAIVQGLVDKQVKAQMEADRRSQPIRRGEMIGPAGFKAVSKGIVEDGKFAGQSVDDVLFVDWMLNKARRISPGRVQPASKDMSDIVSKALSATAAAAGDEYVPTGMAAGLWDDFFTASRVVPTIGTVPMPTDPFDSPLGWGQLSWRKGTPNLAAPSTDPATAKSTLTSTENIAEVDWAYDLDEDSIIAVLPTLRQMVGIDGAEQIDRFVMNADSTVTASTNVNLIDSTPASDAYYLSNGQNGLRYQALVDNTAQASDGTTLTDAKMRTGIALLGKYAVGNGVVMFVDPQTYVSSMMGLTNVVTMDKFGPQATVKTGQLADYQGIPIIVTNSIALTYTAGKTSKTAGSNTKGSILFCDTNMWRVGFRRQLMIELDRDVQKRQLIMVVSFRIAVACRGTRSTNVHTSILYNI